MKNDNFPQNSIQTLASQQRNKEVETAIFITVSFQVYI